VVRQFVTGTAGV